MALLICLYIVYTIHYIVPVTYRDTIIQMIQMQNDCQKYSKWVQNGWQSIVTETERALKTNVYIKWGENDQNEANCYVCIVWCSRHFIYVYHEFWWVARVTWLSGQLAKIPNMSNLHESGPARSLNITHFPIMTIICLLPILQLQYLYISLHGLVGLVQSILLGL